MKLQVHNDGIYAIKGKVDGSREAPSLIADSIEDPNQLQARAIQEVHVELDNTYGSAADIIKLKDFLFGKTGKCCVYFHIDTSSGPYIVKANEQLTVPSDSGTIGELKDLPYVKDVWTA
jgi:DNA polymerase-3 subunit alpha